MPTLQPHLRRLDAALTGLPIESEAMLLSELDGFLVGVVVCPELIMPGEWLPEVFGSEDDRGVFESADDVKSLLDLIMRHYNTVIRDLEHGRFAPIYDVDERNGDVLWELWMSGFSRAMTLRPDSWDAIVDGNDELAAGSMKTMMILSIFADGTSDGVKALRQDIGAEAIDELLNNAPDLVPSLVRALHRWRLESGVPRCAEGPLGGKVGRNVPCPCGSGRKYKRCCGAN